MGTWAQQPPARMTAEQLDDAKNMLRDVANDVKKHYYDPSYHNVDWDTVVRESMDKVEKSAR